MILAQLQTIILEEIDKITDKETLQEMLTFVKNEKGRPEAQEGYHDDQVMSLAITYYIREQQSFELYPIQNIRTAITNRDIRQNSTYGERIQVI